MTTKRHKPEELDNMAKAYKYGDRIDFWAGTTPMTGTVLFAVTPAAVAVQLESGQEIVINLNAVR